MTVIRSQYCRTARPAATPRAFTLVELLVVIVVIGLLISIIGLVGSQVIHTQKIYRTEATMKAVTMAIDQFALDNPLRGVYDLTVPGVRVRTFGPYPPYQVKNSNVGWLVDQYPFASLANRLSQDTGAAGVYIHDVDDLPNNGIRALYAYLRFFVPDALDQVPEASLAPLRPDLNIKVGSSEYIAVSGNTGTASNPESFDVLGIHDAWGAPLDYFLYAKLEYGLDAFGAPGWHVTKRTPVLRSRGITREEYDAQVRNDESSDPDQWILSSELPTPFATVNRTTGAINGTSPTMNGWVRVVAEYPATEDARKSEHAYVP